MEPPLLEEIAPTTVNTGDAFTVIGERFIDPQSDIYTPTVLALNDTEFGGQFRLSSAVHPTATAVSAYMLSVQELELCKTPDPGTYPTGEYSYQRNALSLMVPVMVRRGDVNSTDVKEVLATFGRPHADAAGVYDEKFLYFGAPPAFPSLSKGHHNPDDLGGAAFGEIRLYQQNPSTEIETLWNEVAAGELRDAMKQPTQLTAEHALQFQAIRESGTAVAVDSGQWHDDSLVVTLPQNFNQGYAVIWRDDIPSEVEYFAINDLQQDFRWLVNEAFQVTANPLQIAAGSSCRISIQPAPNCDPAAANFRDYTLAKPGGALKWGIVVTDALGNKCGADTYTSTVTYITGRTGCANIDIMFCPQVHCQERPDRAKNDQYSVKIQATSCEIRSLTDGAVHDVGNCPFDFATPLYLTQQSLPIPSIGVFYQDVEYSGVPLIVVPNTTQLGDGTLGNQHLNADSDVIGTVIQSLLVDLWYGANSLATKLVKLAHTFPNCYIFQNASNGLSYAMEGIDASSVWIFDSTGALSNLQDSVIETHWYGTDNFNDLISSAVIVGVPLSADWAGRCVFRLSQDANYSGTTLYFAVQSTMVTAVPSFCNMAQPDAYAPLPYHLTNDFNWNDQVSSIELIVS